MLEALILIGEQEGPPKGGVLRIPNIVCGFYFLVLHPVAHYTTILNEGTTFRNQTMRVLFIIILHCSLWGRTEENQ
jgi:hypothetical protein